ncbi:Zinc knuckle [Dirofilaria immitis]|nr:Zinc knuckle [Dirofilaria immitis]
MVGVVFPREMWRLRGAIMAFQFVSASLKESFRVKERVDLSKLAKSLITVTDLEEVKRRVRQLWKDGQLEKSQAAKLIRKWRSWQWQKKQKQNREILVNNLSARLDSTEEQTLGDIKQLVNGYVASGKLAYKDGALLVKKWRKRENRRIKRQSEKGSNSVTSFRNVQKKMERLWDPEFASNVVLQSIYCRVVIVKTFVVRFYIYSGFPYATCFVCKQQGHLSRDCDKNANGIYPDGKGSCNLCGSQKHLKKSCSLRKVVNDSSQAESLVAARNSATGGDDDIISIESSTVCKGTKREKLERKFSEVRCNRLPFGSTSFDETIFSKESVSVPATLACTCRRLPCTFSLADPLSTVT